jgi:hypothetical protein
MRISTVYDWVPVFLVVAYIVSLVRDWRPIRSLRDENRDLRSALDEQSKRYDALERKYEDLAAKYATLEKSRDFSSAFQPLAAAIDRSRVDATSEHEKMLAAIDSLERRSEEAWSEIARGLAANTAVISTLAAGIHAGTVKGEPA